MISTTAVTFGSGLTGLSFQRSLQVLHRSSMEEPLEVAGARIALPGTFPFHFRVTDLHPYRWMGLSPSPHIDENNSIPADGWRLEDLFFFLFELI